MYYSKGPSEGYSHTAILIQQELLRGCLVEVALATVVISISYHDIFSTEGLFINPSPKVLVSKLLAHCTLSSEIFRLPEMHL